MTGVVTTVVVVTAGSVVVTTVVVVTAGKVEVTTFVVVTGGNVITVEDGVCRCRI